MTSTTNRWFWQRDPIGRVDLTDETRLELMRKRWSKPSPTDNKKDVAIYNDEAFLKTALRNTREGFAQGFDGVLQEGKLISSNFGFRIEDIRHDLPIQLWYGKYDTNVPPNHGVQIAARLGGRAQLRLEDETHASLLNLRRQILEEMLKNM
jgi:hypothetical protein